MQVFAFLPPRRTARGQKAPPAVKLLINPRLPQFFGPAAGKRSPAPTSNHMIVTETGPCSCRRTTENMWIKMEVKQSADFVSSGIQRNSRDFALDPHAPTIVASVVTGQGFGGMYCYQRK